MSSGIILLKKERCHQIGKQKGNVVGIQKLPVILKQLYDEKDIWDNVRICWYILKRRSYTDGADTTGIPFLTFLRNIEF
jgi:hypothetical protein